MMLRKHDYLLMNNSAESINHRESSRNINNSNMFSTWGYPQPPAQP